MLREFRFGQIMSWRGTLETIPPDFRVCDGTRNTPDLRDLFLVGAGLTYAVGDEAGILNHAHDFTGAGHSMFVPAGTDIATGTDHDSSTDPSLATGTTDPKTIHPTFYSLIWIMSN